MARATRTGTRVDILVVLGCVTVSLFLTILPQPVRDGAAGAVRHTFVGPLIALQAQVERARGAFLRHDLLAARLDSVTLRNSRLNQTERENLRLRALLGLGAQLQTGFVPAEALHTLRPGDTHTVIVTAGSEAGVVERSAVVAPEGLVGLVTSVSSRTASAMLWSHPDFRVSAMSEEGSAFGIVAPHPADGAERYLLELRSVAFRDSLSPGTLIVSSGLGSVFPRGIPVGTVVGELDTGEGWSRTYLLRPVVTPADVSVVMVMLPSAGRTDLSAIWDSPQAADSTRRAIQRVADSLGIQARPDTGQTRREPIR